MKLFSKYILLIILAGGVFLSSCEKMLEFKPENEILIEDALNTAQGLEALKAAGYAELRNFVGGAFQSSAEVLADNIDGTMDHDDYRQVYQRATNYFNGTLNGNFTAAYSAIFRMNSMLDNMGLASDLTAEHATRLEAEARFIRALAHFELLRLYAQPYGYTANNDHPGIAMRLTPSTDPIARSTVQECYDIILEDVLFAEANLPADNDGFATEWAAKALLANIYFQMNDMANAYTMANDVITNGGFTFESDLATRFAERSNSEAIFKILGIDDNNIYPGGTLRGNFASITGPPTLRVSRELYDLMSDDDLRKTAWFGGENIDDPETEFLYTTKYDANKFEVPVFHLTQMMLIAAEATTTTSEAIGYINQIRERAYGNADHNLASDASSTVIEAAIQLERRIELSCEGDRVHYLKYRGAKGDDGGSLKIRGAVWNCPGLILQFPQGEIRGDFIANEEGGC